MKISTTKEVVSALGGNSTSLKVLIFQTLRPHPQTLQGDEKRHLVAETFWWGNTGNIRSRSQVL